MVPPTGEPGGDPTVAADDFIARLREIHDLYDEADRSVREVTEFADEVMIPPVNELRYAGHHVLQAVAAKTDDRRTEHVQKAHRHCERALYDAAEIGIMEAVEIISEFRMAYPTLQISAVIRDYPDILAAARAAQQKVIAGRSKRESARAQATEYMDAFRKLRDGAARLEMGRDDLNAMQLAQQKDHRRFLIRIALAFTAIVVAIVLRLLV